MKITKCYFSMLFMLPALAHGTPNCDITNTASVVDQSLKNKVLPDYMGLYCDPGQDTNLGVNVYKHALKDCLSSKNLACVKRLSEVTEEALHGLRYEATSQRDKVKAAVTAADRRRQACKGSALHSCQVASSLPAIAYTQLHLE